MYIIPAVEQLTQVYLGTRHWLLGINQRWHGLKAFPLSSGSRERKKNWGSGTLEQEKPTRTYPITHPPPLAILPSSFCSLQSAVAHTYRTMQVVVWSVSACCCALSNAGALYATGRRIPIHIHIHAQDTHTLLRCCRPHPHSDPDFGVLLHTGIFRGICIHTYIHTSASATGRIPLSREPEQKLGNAPPSPNARWYSALMQMNERMHLQVHTRNIMEEAVSLSGWLSCTCSRWLRARGLSAYSSRAYPPIQSYLRYRVEKGPRFVGQLGARLVGNLTWASTSARIHP